MHAETAKGTFYLYFESWGAYLAAIRDFLLAEYQLEMGTRLHGMNRQNYWDMFDGEIEEFVRWMLGHGNLHRSVFHGAEVTQEVPKELSALTAVGDMLEAGKRFGCVEPGTNSPVAARLIMSVLHSAVDAITEGESVDVVVGEVIRFVRASVRVSETG